MNDALVYTNKVKERAGLHVLLIGVSEYPHLTSISQPPQLNDGAPGFGLRSLTSSAYTVGKLANWILQNRTNFATRLASCRVLVSPSEIELQSRPELGEYVLANLVNVRQAAREWRDDAQHPDSHLLFYFAGHGVQRKHLESVTDQLLLLRDFGDPGAPAFTYSFSANDFIDAMAPGEDENANVARTQYFIFDACRNSPEALEKYDRIQSGSLLDIDRRSPHDDRRIAVIRSTAAGSGAFANANGLTYFAEALLLCLNGGVGEQSKIVDFSQAPEWYVTFGALEQGITFYIKQDNGVGRPEFTGTMGRDAVLYKLPAAPTFPVTVLIDPATASDCACIQFLDQEDKPAVQLPTPVSPNPHVFSLCAGLYRYRSAFNHPFGQPPLTSPLFPLERPGRILRVSPRTSNG